MAKKDHLKCEVCGVESAVVKEYSVSLRRWTPKKDTWDYESTTLLNRRPKLCPKDSGILKRAIIGALKREPK